MNILWVASLAALLADVGTAAAAMFNQSQAQAQLQASGSCCAALSAVLPNEVFTPGQIAYSGSLGSYWSQQEQQMQPKCVIVPKAVGDVQTAILILAVANELGLTCQFAVKSGGHTPFAGAANIQNGITLDLSNFKQVDVSSDQTQVSIGPGNRWADVYTQLDQLGVSTSGGRDASVGVGGLTLGGGISFFSGRYGLVCDNVVNFQVVLASGQLVDVNANSYPDLFKALKGGSNNFGVVVRFDMKLFQQGPFWGGFVGNLISDREKQFQYFQDFASSSNYDPYSALILSYSWSLLTGWINANNFEYTKPQANPPAFAQFNSLPKTFSTLRIDKLTSFTEELSAVSPAGQRDLFVTLTVGNSAEMLSTFFNLSDATVRTLPLDPKLQFSVSFQPLPQTIISKAAGTNSLGLDASDGDLANILLTIQWLSPTNDDAIYAAAKSLISQAKAAAQSLGTYNPYLYLNYAASWQDPIASYGSSSVSALKAASQKYDPTGVFQKDVPGGFKLGLY